MWHATGARPFKSRRITTAIAVLLVCGCAAPLAAESRSAADAEERFVRRARAVMAALRAESRVDAARIQEAYATDGAFVAFEDRDALVAAASVGTVRPLPGDASRFNIRPRLHGAHPIGEKDLAHQPLYVAAHPGTLGLLLHVAARTQAVPLEVTSLVRHHAYQRALQRTNPNARTARSMHTLGLAFDISILNIPVAAAEEIRDVLRHMRDEGALFFLAETRQLVFHVVPNPERLHLYAALFDGLTSLPPPPAPSRLAAAPPPPSPLLALSAGALPALSTAPTSLAYAGVFAFLAAAGIGTPPGEDMALVWTSALLEAGLLAWWPVLPLAILAVVATDVLMFCVGRGGGRCRAARPLRALGSSRRREASFRSALDIAHRGRPTSRGERRTTMAASVAEDQDNEHRASV